MLPATGKSFFVFFFRFPCAARTIQTSERKSLKNAVVINFFSFLVDFDEKNNIINKKRINKYYNPTLYETRRTDDTVNYVVRD